MKSATQLRQFVLEKVMGTFRDGNKATKFPVDVTITEPRQDPESGEHVSQLTMTAHRVMGRKAIARPIDLDEAKAIRDRYDEIIEQMESR